MFLTGRQALAKGVLALAVLTAIRPAPAQMSPGEIDVFLPGRQLETFMPIPISGSSQMALLDDGAVVVTDGNNRQIALIGTDGTVRVLAQVTETRNVAALPGNRVVYSSNRVIRIHDVNTGQVTPLGSLPSDDYLAALGADAAGNVYAGTQKNALYRFAPDGRRDLIASNLPFRSTGAITDIAAAQSGEVYVGGSTRAIKVVSGKATVIADNLTNESVAVSLRPDGKVYIDEISKHIQLYDPATGALSSFTAPVLQSFVPFGKILAPSNEEIVFYEQTPTTAFYRVNVVAGTAVVLATFEGNGGIFTVAGDGFPYIGTAWKTLGQTTLKKSLLARLGPGGTLQPFDSLPLSGITAIKMDAQDRLCIVDGMQFKRLEPYGSMTVFSPFRLQSAGRLAVASNGDWFVGSRVSAAEIRIYRVSEGAADGQVVATIDSTLLSGTNPSGIGMAVTPQGELAILAAASVSAATGPTYQRVFRANLDGSRFREVANLDSQRVGCMIDLAAAPNGDLYALVCAAGGTGSPDSIFRIDESNLPVEVVRLAPGNDPKSVAVDSQGNLWFTATNGVYRVAAAPASNQPRIYSAMGVLNGGSWGPDFAPNSWISIFGTNLAPTSRAWTDSDFAGNRLPAQLDGVSVKIGGKPAYPAYISPEQLNVLIPDLAPSGPYDVQVVTPAGTSNSVSIPMPQYAPTLFRFGAAGGRYVAAVHADGAYVGDAAVLPGIGATPARPGEIISLYGSGFGTPTGDPDPGVALQAPQTLANAITLQIRIGGVIAPVKYAGLVSAGLVQINVEVPQLPDGDQQVQGAFAGTLIRNKPYVTVQAQR